jgi:CheY-like chemotaxis protein
MERPVSQPPLTILIVDDNPVDVHLIRWVLDAHALPYALQVIDNGDRAIEVFDQLAQLERRRSPTIILLDLNVPQRDGGRDWLRDPRERAEPLALGADAFFPKPFHLTPFMQ